MASAKLLVVEDEVDIRELLVLHLKREGYNVEAVGEGEQALERLKKGDIDLVVLDWMLPTLSGVEIARQLSHSAAGKPPILMVTARADTHDIVVGLEAGADDYLVKPFEVPILLARVRALLRRVPALSKSIPASEVPSVSPLLYLGDIELDTETYRVTCRGRPIALTLSEFKLLASLTKTPGKVMSREALIEEVQGAGVSVVDRAIDTHIFGLRKKLGEFGDWIETVRGVGYRARDTGAGSLPSKLEDKSEEA